MNGSCGCSGTGCCTCGCCDGVKVVTPLSTENPPGLSALSYRAGTHDMFFESMTASLTASGDPQLRYLATRSADDPAIALLDGWATVADILTFYQERIANEGYLRTAVERRSVTELARLVGYRMRPGVSASTHLAYTIDSQFTGDAIIPVGTRANSVPGPGEQQQTFEASDGLIARASWNILRPRLTMPQTFASITRSPAGGPRLYIQGVSANLKANDMILLQPGDAVFRVGTATLDTIANRTIADMMDWSDPQPSDGQKDTVKGVSISDLARSPTLFKPGSVPPASSRQLPRTLKMIAPDSEASFGLFDAFMPETKGRLLEAAGVAKVTADADLRAYTFRVKSTLFASNLPGLPTTTIATGKSTDNEKTQVVTTEFKTPPTLDNTVAAFFPKKGMTLALDAEYNQIQPGSFIVVEYPSPITANPNRRLTQIATVLGVETRTLTFGGASNKVTLVTFRPPLKPKLDEIRGDPKFLTGTIVYAQSELLPLAEQVITEPVCGGAESEIELDNLYTNLEPGRWLIITGERSDIPGAEGVTGAELLMLSSVRHGVAQIGGSTESRDLPGDKLHTFITLAKDFAYCYKRDTVRIYGNVVHATHGETRREVLGNADASMPFQQFTLKQSPLTYVSAATPSGVESTLQVFVNDVGWHEVESLAGLRPYDRSFITKTAAASTRVVFGDGTHGAQTPSGLENLRAVYRNGIGKGGNVQALQISQLGDRPLGVTEVVNPLPATGGADAESRDQGRRNAPLATTALDRLVSVQDYADFARTFAGISKASAAELPGRHGRVVHVTIAGLDDIPIAEDSDLFRNLRTALVRYGDPIQPVQLAVRDRILLVISAGVKVMTDYLWEKVGPKVCAVLLDTLGFDKRELGQDAFLSEAIAAMQAVEGVEYVDVNAFGGVPGLKQDGTRLSPTEIADAVKQIDLAPPQHRVAARVARFTGTAILPAQVACFAAGQPEAMVLNEVKS